MERTIGATDYARFCRALNREPDFGLSPSARTAAIPEWLCPALVATPAAVTKLQEWAARTPQPWNSPSPADVLANLSLVGDTVLAHVVARLLSERIPAPVADYVVKRVTFVAVGLRTLGFCSPPLPAADRPFVIALSIGGDDDAALARFQDIVGHELSHAWLLEEHAPDTVAAGTLWMQTLHELPMTKVAALAPSTVDAVTEQRQVYASDERLARALSQAWGFHDL